MCQALVETPKPVDNEDLPLGDFTFPFLALLVETPKPLEHEVVPPQTLPLIIF